MTASSSLDVTTWQGSGWFKSIDVRHTSLDVFRLALIYMHTHSLTSKTLAFEGPLQTCIGRLSWSMNCQEQTSVRKIVPVWLTLMTSLFL